MAKRPDLSFKGVVNTKKDFYSVIKAHVESGTDRAPRDWSNNEEFKRLRVRHKLTVAQCAEIVGKSIFAVQSCLKPERCASSVNVPMTLWRQFAHISQWKAINGFHLSS